MAKTPGKRIWHMGWLVRILAWLRIVRPGTPPRVEWQLVAFRETLQLAERNNMWKKDRPGSLSYEHLVEMQSKMHEGMSPGKLGRWLGWAQAAVVSAGCGSLSDMKDINRRCSRRVNPA